MEEEKQNPGEKAPIILVANIEKDAPMVSDHFLLCKNCVEEIGPYSYPGQNQRFRELSQLEVLKASDNQSIQVWCRRHQRNVATFTMQYIGANRNFG